MSKTKSPMDRHLEVCAKVCGVMADAGYESVFEKVTKTMTSQNVYTLWVSGDSRPSVMSMVFEDNQPLFYQLNRMEAPTPKERGDE